MPLDPNAVADQTIEIAFEDWLRIFPSIFARTPLGIGWADSRFAVASQYLRSLYVSQTLRGALCEAILRDRFEALPDTRRVIDASELGLYSVASLSTRRPLKLLDLRGQGVFRLGVSTDAVGAKAHAESQRFAVEVFHAYPAIDGVLYASRICGDDCMAIFDRGDEDLFTCESVADLCALRRLLPTLASLAVAIV